MLSASAVGEGGVFLRLFEAALGSDLGAREQFEAVAALPFSLSWSTALRDLVPGLVFSLSGAITLTLYFRRNKPPEQAAQ